MKRTYNLKETEKAGPSLGPAHGVLKNRINIEEVVDKLDLATKLNLQRTGESLRGTALPDMTRRITNVLPLI